MALVINTAYLKPLGSVEKVLDVDPKIFTGIFKFPTDKAKLITYMSNILENNFSRISGLDFNRSATSVFTSGENLYDILIEVFDQHTKKIYVQLNDKITNKTFTLNNFVQIYNEYTTNARLLRHYTKFFDTFYKSDKFFHIVKNYMFYYNVVKPEYSQKYLSELIIENIKSDLMNDLLNVVKLFNFYSMMYSNVKNTYPDMFDRNTIELSSSDAPIIPNEIVLKTVHNVHAYAIACAEGKTTSETFKHDTETIIDQIKMCIKFGDKITFLLNYINLLQERIIKKKINYGVEYELMTTIGFNSDNDLLFKIKRIIIDYKTSSLYQKLYRENAVTLDKYAGCDISAKKTADISVVQDYAWEDGKYIVKDVFRMNEPRSIAVYIDMLKGFFNCVPENTGKNLSVNYDHSIVVFSTTFGEKTYKIKSTLLQAVLFQHINEHESVKVLSLPESLGVPISKFDMALKSLLMAGFIKKDSTGSLVINTAWTYKKDETNIDIVDLMRDMPALLEKAKKPVIKYDDSVCRALLFGYLNTVESATVEKMSEYLTGTDSGKDTVVTDINIIMKPYVESGTVLFNENTYVLKKQEYLDSDSDDELEEVVAKEVVAKTSVIETIVEVKPTGEVIITNPMGEILMTNNYSVPLTTDLLPPIIEKQVEPIVTKKLTGQNKDDEFSTNSDESDFSDTEKEKDDETEEDTEENEDEDNEKDTTEKDTKDGKHSFVVNLMNFRKFLIAEDPTLAKNTSFVSDLIKYMKTLSTKKTNNPTSTLFDRAVAEYNNSKITFLKTHFKHNSEKVTKPIVKLGKKM